MRLDDSAGAVSDYVCFFFQAEDGIRDADVTGVQTCALPISLAREAHRDRRHVLPAPALLLEACSVDDEAHGAREIGRASCRESVDLGGRRIIKKKKDRSVAIMDK